MAEASLEQLHDLALPEAIGFWPLAPGLLILACLLVGALLLAAWSLWRRQRVNAYRRRARKALRALALACEADPLQLQELLALLKHTALQVWPREQIAPLSGDAWLAFLARQAPTCELPDSLAEVGYWPAERVIALPAAERERLLRVVEHWIGQHVRP